MGEFGAKVRQWTVEVKAKNRDVIRKIALDAFSEVVLKTPVDTGRARMNWQPSINAIPGGTLEAFDPSGQLAIAAVQAKVAEFEVGDIIYLANNLPYIESLENGHSRDQAPHGMVKLTAQRFQIIAQRAMAKFGNG